MSSRSISLRERKKERTRVLLVETANRLFLEGGFESITVDRITEEAGVSQRTFFRYFPSKEDVVFSKHPKRLARFRQLLSEQRQRRPPGRAVRAALEAFALEYQRAREELLREWRVVTSSPLLIARDVEQDLEFETAIAELLTDGQPAGDGAARRARILAGAVFGAVRATMQEWYSDGCRQDLVQLGRDGFQLVDGLLGD